MSIYNHQEILPKMSECVSILECSGIWIVSGKFGISWRPAQMKVYKNETKLTNYAFIDDPAEIEETEEQEEEDDLLDGEV
jgi:hypothetical protein